jgi:phenylacetate-CoA ligase
MFMIRTSNRQVAPLQPTPGAFFHERERLQFEEWRERSRPRLLAQLRQVAANSRLYARKWSGELRGELLAAEPRGAAELLERLPFTLKDELRESQERTPPFGEHLACDPARVTRVHRTSGTTGRPLLIALSERDAAVARSHGAQAFWCAGLRSEDVVVHCLSYSMWSGGVTDHMCLEGTGAAVVPFGVGNTEGLVELARWLPFTALSCTPSYVSLLLDRLAGSEDDRRRWAGSVRLLLVGGEPGGSSRALRDSAHDTLGATVANANYGLAEVLSIFGSACPDGDAFHFHGQDALWIELVEASTGRPVEPQEGAVGELVLTHLDREAQPLVRYRTNDLLRVSALGGCPCGRAGLRFELLGRADDMFVVRGINVFPGAIADVLGEVDQRLREFIVVLPDAQPFHAIPLKVEAPPGTCDTAALASQVQAAIKTRLGCSATVEVLPAGSLPRSEGKTQRIVRAGGGRA